MKIFTITPVLAFLIFLSGTSCKKDPLPSAQAPIRIIKYQLYTNIDFSGNNDTIKFSLFMRNRTRTLFDSALAPMKISEIPNATNKIIFEKIVPDNDGSELSVGFLYSIEGVGNSWYLDTVKAGETFKVIDYAFQ
jgi:hypothetical protein